MAAEIPAAHFCTKRQHNTTGIRAAVPVQGTWRKNNCWQYTQLKCAEMSPGATFYNSTATNSSVVLISFITTTKKRISTILNCGLNFFFFFFFFLISVLSLPPACCDQVRTWECTTRFQLSHHPSHPYFDSCLLIRFLGFLSDFHFPIFFPLLLITYAYKLLYSLEMNPQSALQKKCKSC